MNDMEKALKIIFVVSTVLFFVSCVGVLKINL